MIMYGQQPKLFMGKGGQNHEGPQKQSQQICNFLKVIRWNTWLKKYWNNISIPEIAFAKLEGNNSL